MNNFDMNKHEILDYYALFRNRREKTFAILKLSDIKFEKSKETLKHFYRFQLFYKFFDTHKVTFSEKKIQTL